MKFIIEIINSIISLIAGLVVTLINFVRKPITTQYPYEKREIADRFRGAIKWDSSSCNACEICNRICPAGALDVKIVKENKKRKVEQLMINYGMCIYCGLCVENCPTNSLTHTKTYEYSKYTREELICYARK